MIFTSGSIGDHTERKDDGEISDADDALEHGEATEHDEVAAADVAEGLDDSASPGPGGAAGGGDVDRDEEDAGRAAADLNGGAGGMMDLAEGNVPTQV